MIYAVQLSVARRESEQDMVQGQPVSNNNLAFGLVA